MEKQEERANKEGGRKEERERERERARLIVDERKDSWTLRVFDWLIK